MKTFRRIAACLLLSVILLSAGTLSTGATKLITVVPSPLLGDADGDGSIGILDATIIQRYLASFAVSNPETIQTRGDIDKDGLDIQDATMIQRYLANYTVPYDIGQPME